MMNDYQPDVDLLRHAAERREWSELQEILTRLLVEMEFFGGVEIAITRAYNHLPIFEASQPESDWARSLLVWITSYGTAPANLPPEASVPHNSPGAANYIAALIDLTRAMERMTPLENRVRFLASAISNTLLAELAATWYSEHPDAWVLQSEHGDETDVETGTMVRQEIYTQFWLDEATAVRDTAAWLEVADAVERIQNRLRDKGNP